MAKPDSPILLPSLHFGLVNGTPSRVLVLISILILMFKFFCFISSIAIWLAAFFKQPTNRRLGSGQNIRTRLSTQGYLTGKTLRGYVSGVPAAWSFVKCGGGLVSHFASPIDGRI